MYNGWFVPDNAFNAEECWEEVRRWQKKIYQLRINVISVFYNIWMIDFLDTNERKCGNGRNRFVNRFWLNMTMPDVQLLLLVLFIMLLLIIVIITFYYCYYYYLLLLLLFIIIIISANTSQSSKQFKAGWSKGVWHAVNSEQNRPQQQQQEL